MAELITGDNLSSAWIRGLEHLVATGNGRWDGRRHWGDSVLMLSPNAGRLLQRSRP